MCGYLFISSNDMFRVQLVSGGLSGDVVLTDLRNLAESVVKIAAHSNSDLNALAVRLNVFVLYVSYFM